MRDLCVADVMAGATAQLAWYIAVDLSLTDEDLSGNPIANLKLN